MWTRIYRHIAKVYAISRGFYVGSFVLMAKFTVSLHRKVGSVVSVEAIQLEIFNSTKLFEHAFRHTHNLTTSIHGK